MLSASIVLLCNYNQVHAMITGLSNISNTPLTERQLQTALQRKMGKGFESVDSCLMASRHNSRQLGYKMHDGLFLLK